MPFETQLGPKKMFTFPVVIEIVFVLLKVNLLQLFHLTKKSLHNIKYSLFFNYSGIHVHLPFLHNLD